MTPEAGTSLDGLPSISMTSASSNNLSVTSVCTVTPVALGSGGAANGNVKLWAYVPRSVVDNIICGKFVELNTLLPPGPAGEAAPNVLTLGDNSGFLTLSHQNRGKKIDSIDAWLEAWTTYAAIYAGSHPQSAADLLAYQHMILNAARKFKFASVAEYNRLFRCSRAADSAVKWDCVLHTLYTTIFDSRALMPFRAGAAAASGAAAPGSSTELCRLFNRGECSRPVCRYRHACSTCSANDHGALQYPPSHRNPGKRPAGRPVSLDSNARGPA